ncbi:MAG: 50S ribosomal protein P1, partial [Candidatus Pacearchaeota archaeon]|nr:50S ribosomal protein P1 [Candidatus Pacearchaeota archaeon]
MQYIYAALLLHKAGKEINEENLKKVIEAAGVTIDEARIKTVVASLKGIDIDKALQEAATMPMATGTQTAGAKA